MRFDGLTLLHMGAYKGAVSIDFNALPGPLIAVCGPNGAGKSTLLELLAGTLYRTTPTRGTLASLATGRDAFCEVRVTNGQSYTIRQTVDASSGKGESLVLDEHGATVLDSGKVRQFDEWAQKHLTLPEVLYTSSFAVQGRRGFLDCTPAERKAVLVRVLGLERLERLADDARSRARFSQTALEVLNARLTDLAPPDIESLRALALEHGRLVGLATEGLLAARVALERVLAAAEDVRRAREIGEQRKAVLARKALLAAQSAEITVRIDNNRALLGRGETIRQAVARSSALQIQYDEKRAAMTAIGTEVETRRAQAVAADAAHKRAQQHHQQTHERAVRTEARLAERDAVLAAGKRAEQARERVTVLETALTEHEQRVAELQQLMLTGKDVRITGLRDGLQGIANYKKPTDRGMHPSAERELTAQAMVALDADTHRATAGEQAPAALTALHSSIAHVRGNLQHGKQELDKHARMAARADEMERAAYDLKVAQQETAAAAGEVSAALVALTTARGLVDQALGQYHALLAELAPLATEISTLAGEVALLPRLEQAQSRLEELSAQLQPCTAQLAQADAELAALPELTAVAGTDVQTYRAAVTRCELAEHEHRKAQSMADRAVIEGAAVLARREQLQAQITAGADELSDWTRLGQDLGRDGLQAMELDACLPELNATANDLLHHCHGSRFTVQLHTDRLSADGKRVIEGLDVRVIDTLEGRDALAETYSGGEAVIVGEAVALALTMLACRRSGHDAPTLVRDESGAALDAACGVAYVAMLRRAAGLIGAHRVLFVSHDVSLQALADSRITITDDHQVQVGGAA